MLPVGVSNQQPPSAFATFPGENGKIAFVSDRDRGVIFEIYIMNADGSNPIRLTDNTAFDGEPDWSPDGTKIAFSSGRSEGTQIYIMNADGSNPIKLTDIGFGNFQPSWSPDGTKIAFTSTRDGDFEIYVIDADGTEQTRLTNNPAFDTLPSWSPDGTKIAFTSTRDGNNEIYIMNADGSNPIRLTNNDATDEKPDWSPDGTKIAFYSGRNIVNNENYEIYIMNADGSNPIRLTDNTVSDIYPSWSPDGTKIAFWRGSGPSNEIYVMNADGSNPIRLTNNDAQDVSPDWGASGVSPPPLDTTAPILTVPEDITEQAPTADDGVVVMYTVTAQDNVDGTATLEDDNSLTQDDVGGNIIISCDPPSGTEFQIGETIVQCTATDAAGNSNTASFTVTINPPPEPLTAEITADPVEGDAPLTVEFQAIVTGGTPPYTHNWDFGDGTTEEESIEPTTSHTYDESGTYTVTLTVIDSEGQEAADSLEVTVNEQTTEPPPPPPTTPREAIERLISYIENLEDVPENAKTRLASVLERALALLSDNNTRNDASACNMLGSAFINQVNANERRGSVTEDQAADVRTQVEDIRDMMGC